MLIHKGTVALETESLILRSFTTDDAEDMFLNWASDAEVARYLSWVPHASVDVTRQVLTDWVNAYENIDNYNWAIVPKEYGKVIGHIAVNEISEKNLRCSIGYCISRVFWNKGITTEAYKIVIDFLFSEVGVNRIQAKHDSDNPASGKVMEKVGMKYEGTLRQYRTRKDGSFGSSKMYSILRDDYLNA
jgi:[ribosomal protein S5]-alanine N-acetyltransferase